MLENNNLYVRYSIGRSEQKLSERLGLYWDNTMQDWDLVVSDFVRIPDFLKIYQTELNDDDDKFTLMRLIISSFDDGISQADKKMTKNWKTCEAILEKECFLHYSTISYWSLIYEGNDDDVFSITPFMRKVWFKVKFKFL